MILTGIQPHLIFGILSNKSYANTGKLHMISVTLFKMTAMTGKYRVSVGEISSMGIIQVKVRLLILCYYCCYVDDMKV